MATTHSVDGFFRPYWYPNKGPELAEDYKSTIFISSILYIPLVLLGQYLMKNRPPFSLKKAVIAWNLLLGGSSILGSFLILFYDWDVLTHVYFDEENYIPSTRAVIALFTLTKAMEYGDTLFLVLKKKKIIFLHLYHHLTVTLYCWHAQYVNISFGHHFALINLLVHSVMYSYYAMSVILPRNRFLIMCRPYITLSQTLQMFAGIVVSSCALTSNSLPHTFVSNAKYALAMYISYALLFTKFFIENYTKSLRPNVTIYVATIHLLSIIGVYLIFNHESPMQLTAELFCGFLFTLTLWGVSTLFIRNTPKKTNANFLSRMIHFCLLVFNCIAAWLKEYTFVHLLDEIVTHKNYDSTPKLEKLKASDIRNRAVQAKAKKEVAADDNSSSSSVSSIHSGSTTTSTKDSTHTVSTKSSILGQFLKINPKSKDDSTTIKKPNNSTYFQIALDWWVLILCWCGPALYGLQRHNNIFIGLCVHGALRWTIELHTISFLLKKVYRSLKIQ